MFLSRNIVTLSSKASNSINKRCSIMIIKSHFSAETDQLEKTALFDYHQSIGGKMVPFAGYSLPVQYTGLGVMKEHTHTRAEDCASVFDVSHMGQIKWYGKDRMDFIEKMVCGDIKSLEPGTGKLSLIMNESGTIMDDTVITNAGDYVYMVVNGACKAKDMAHFKKYMEMVDLDVQMEYMETQQLLALQGKGAMKALATLCPSLDLTSMSFMTSTDAKVAGIDCKVTRCGYTGEDGFEISVPFDETEKLADALFAIDNVKPAGLGARDSLRLEAGLCLYGNDIDETTNPVESALTWTIGGPKSRRRIEQGFLGAETFLTNEGKLKPVQRKRVGIMGMKAPAREHIEIYSPEGNKIGEVTSGGFGPTVGKPIAMGYVETNFSKVDTDVMLNIRGKMQPAKIAKTPFTETHYYKP